LAVSYKGCIFTVTFKTLIMKINDWVLFPLTKDDYDNPTIVAKVLSIEGNIVKVLINGEPVSIPKTWCKVVYVQI